MKQWMTVLALVLAFSAQAHDEGHGPKLTDAGKYGGVVAPVIEAKDASKGAKAPLVHKAELIRTEEGTIRVYFYDADMKPLDPKGFAPEAQGFVEFKKNKKWTKTAFKLKLEEGTFIGKAPKVATRPFNIDVHVTEGGKKLMAAFDHLD